MIKADRNEAPARPDSLAGAAPCPPLKTLFYFNELNEHVNEKICTSDASR
jgi:hypothetical protein